MTDDPLIGRQLSNFLLERVLGRGGMAQVYYGMDVKLNRPVAVKVIDARFRDNPAYAKRFVGEARSVARWRHENIGQVYYADEEDGLYYFAMEYIDGLNLEQLLTRYASDNELMPDDDVLRIGKAVAGALDYAHSNNVVHRDVKPSNILIAQDGRVVLTDFGLALDVQQGSVGEVFGSTHYIAPEQAHRSSEAIPQSDLYSLGIMLYEMLTGVVPFDDPSPTAIALQHITQPPPSPRTLNASLAIDTENVLLKALSKSPQERYQTGDALITALENSFNAATEIGQDLPLPPPPPGMELRSQPSLASREAVIEAGATSAKPTEIPAPITLLDGKPPAPSRDTPLPDQPSKPEKSLVRRPSFLWLGFGGCVLVLIMLTVGVSLFYSNFRNDDPQNIEPAIAAETKSDIVSTTTAINTPPGDVPEISSPDPSTPGLSVLPTVKYPNGKRFMLFYDDNSFYLLNLSDDTLPVNWIAFERLSDAGLPLNRYNGTRWAEFYPDSRPTWCVGLEILDNPPYLEPPECGHDDLYLSLRTPVRDDPTVFWTSMQGSQQFRVLWREGGIDEEIARCEIDEGLCEVFLP